MSRETKFNDLMKVVYAAGEKMNRYELSPHEYGTDDLLYMTEAHMVDMIGSDKVDCVTDIARITGKTKGAVTQTLEKLVRKDLVMKITDPNDSRRKILQLTDKGGIVRKNHSQKDEVAFERFLSRLGEYKDDDLVAAKEIIAQIFKIKEGDLLKLP